MKSFLVLVAILACSSLYVASSFELSLTSIASWFTSGEVDRVEGGDQLGDEFSSSIDPLAVLYGIDAEDLRRLDDGFTTMPEREKEKECDDWTEDPGGEEAAKNISANAVSSASSVTSVRRELWQRIPVHVKPALFRRLCSTRVNLPMELCNSCKYNNCKAGTKATSCRGKPHKSHNQIPKASNCKMCPGGEISGSCTVKCNVCAKGKFETSSNKVCNKCPRGRASSVAGISGVDRCNVCQAGTGATSDGTRCSVCSAGRFASSSGADCNPCAAGK
jgi:hypothetical protein